MGRGQSIAGMATPRCRMRFRAYTKKTCISRRFWRRPRKRLRAEKVADCCRPDGIHWVDGSQAEYEFLCDRLVEAGTFRRLNQKLWPECFLARSAPSDVARGEDRTFICSLSKDAAGPTNNWEDPYEMRRKLKQLFKGCMRGR